MKTTPTILAAALMIAGIFAGCDSSPSADRPENEEWAAGISANLESAVVEPMAKKSATGEDQYLATITFADNPSIDLPNAVNVLAQAADQPNAAVFDDGRGVDAVSGDGVFTGIVPNGCMSETDAAGKDAGASCTLDIVGPGGECGTYGTCPKSAHRSFLWGLIDYHTDIVFCFCLVECEFSI